MKQTKDFPEESDQGLEEPVKEEYRDNSYGSQGNQESDDEEYSSGGKKKLKSKRKSSNSIQKERKKSRKTDSDSYHEDDENSKERKKRPVVENTKCAPDPVHEPGEVIGENEQFMTKDERMLDHSNPRYHFCKFLSRHYRLIADRNEKKNFFSRMQPIFTRFLHVLKAARLPLIEIDTFTKYLKKFYKRRGLKYRETTNKVDMRVIVGIDRRTNSKFDF